MSFWQYLWDWRLQPYNIANIFAFILFIVDGILVWKLPKWEAKLKHLLWIVPLAIVVVLTPIALITASYQLYDDGQQELSAVYEEYRPILTLDPN